jgi:hypothetical protein
MQNASLSNDLALVGEIIATIERYNGSNGIEACPSELCDTMLTVAGLLHLEAARLYSAEDCQPVEGSFLERASINLEKVKWASSRLAKRARIHMHLTS